MRRIRFLPHRRRRPRALETALATPEASPAPLRLRGPETRPVVATRAEATLRLRRACPRLVDLQSPTLQLGPVEAIDGLSNCRWVVERHEGKPARLPRRAVDGKKHLRHVANLAEQGFELGLRCAEIEVANEDLG